MGIGQRQLDSAVHALGAKIHFGLATVAPRGLLNQFGAETTFIVRPHGRSVRLAPVQDQRVDGSGLQLPLDRDATSRIG